jgi:hypothetical protein
MIEKALPHTLVTIKNEINRFLLDLLQRTQQKARKADASASVFTEKLNDAVTEKQVEETDEIKGDIEFVLPSSSLPAAKKLVAINDFFTDLPAEVLSEFQKSLPSVSSKLTQELELMFKDATAKKIFEKKQKDTDNLQLIDEEDLMYRLVLDHFSMKVNEEYKVAIAVVCLRIEKVLGYEIDILLSPLSPYNIGSIIEKSVASLDIGVANKKLLLLAVLKSIIVEYKLLLKAVNEVFIKKRILPNLTEVDGKKRIDKYLRKMQAIENGEEDPDSSGSGSGSSDGSGLSRDFFEKISVPQESEHFISANPNGVMISPDQLLSNIGSIQNLLAQKDVQTGYFQPAETDATFSELLSSNSNISEFALSGENSKTISIISMLFDTLKAEEGISSPIKALLLQLTVPLLKAAVQDDDFFSDNSNPAQILFNSIAEASSSWSAESTVDKDFLYQKMSSIVQRVTDDYEHDYSVFESAVEDFEDFVGTEKKKSERIEERIIAAETAQARVAAAWQLARHRIYEIFGDYILDQALKNFLDKTWEYSLFYIANNTIDSEHATEWAPFESVEVKLKALLNYEVIECTVDDLLTEIKTVCMTAGRAIEEISEECELLRPELTELMSHADKPMSERKIEQHTNIVQMKPKSALVEVVDVDYITGLDDELTAFEIKDMLDDAVSMGDKIDDYENDIQAKKEAEMHELLSQIGVGSWLEDHEASPFVKVKLAAHIKYTDTYVFVNRQGIKAASYDGPTFALRLKEKVMVIINNSQLYDRSMEHVISNLRA